MKPIPPVCPDLFCPLNPKTGIRLAMVGLRDESSIFIKKSNPID
jgi:hypothetical protein